MRNPALAEAHQRYAAVVTVFALLDRNKSAALFFRGVNSLPANVSIFFLRVELSGYRAFASAAARFMSFYRAVGLYVSAMRFSWVLAAVFTFGGWLSF